MAEFVYSFNVRYSSGDTDVARVGLVRGQTPEHAEERLIRGLESDGYTNVRIHIHNPLCFTIDPDPPAHTIQIDTPWSRYAERSD